MVKYILKRFLIALGTVFMIATVSFFLLHSLPGNPFGSLSSMNKDMQERLIAFYQLDRPIGEQYVTYIKNLLRGEFGYSLKYSGQSVNNIISKSFPYSAWLGIQAFLISFPIGILLGSISSLKHKKLADCVISAISALGATLPIFIIGTLLQYVFAVKLKWFPIATWKDFSHTVLPSLTLAIGPIALKTRAMRTLMIEISTEDYITTARAKGLTYSKIVIKHQLRNAILPIVSTLGLEFASIIMGSMIVEQIFAIPGLGGYYVSSIQNLDYTMTLGLTLFFSVLVIALNLLVDVFYGIIDPRVKVHRSA